jgi:hypothetical protein
VAAPLYRLLRRPLGQSGLHGERDRRDLEAGVAREPLEVAGRHEAHGMPGPS